MTNHIEVLRYMIDPETQSDAEIAALQAAISALSAQTGEAVAELIAADKEYDEASYGYNPLFAGRAAVDRYAAAVERRRAALALVAGK